MIQCEGTVLDAPVPIDKERNEVPMTPERAIKKKELNGLLLPIVFFKESPDGEVICAAVVMSAFEGIACVTPEQFKKVVFLFSKDCAIIQQFFDDLVAKCRERGLQVDSEPLQVYYNITIDEFENCIEDAARRFSSLRSIMYYNIALKINAKLGGINQAVIFDDDSRSAEAPQKDAVMYVGIDVTHPTSKEDYDISIACMVANIDLAATR
uniref:Piwi domain-containing protein n=1 Tax=Angiostrongylus cantonensis TaxID=6313 RepID=A0A0K0D612_ANGCA